MAPTAPAASLVRSTLGSLSEGAVSPNGLTEGVYYVGFYAPKSFESVGEALSLPQRWILASIQ